MIHKAFTIYDAKAKAHLPPFFLPQVGQATRHFTDACNDPKTMFSQHPEDYHLNEVGSFDDDTGLFQAFDSPRLVCSALQCVIPPGDTSQPQLANLEAVT